MNSRVFICLLILLGQIVPNEGTPVKRVGLGSGIDSGLSCFPLEATVNLENGKSASMSELKVGDRVQTVSSSGMVTYNKVRIFMKKTPNEITWYKSIKTSVNKTINLSPDHLIYTRICTGKFKAIYAKDVSIGDEMLVNGNRRLIPAKVIDISTSKMQGAYTPVVMEGKIVVDGVLASCYAFCDHDLAHIGMTPIGWLPYITDFIFGNENGSPVCVNVIRDVGNLLVPHQFQFNKE